MKRSFIIFITLVSLTIMGSNVMAGGVQSAFGPGNSAAGKGSVFPDSQPNCLGDIFSTLARRGEVGHPSGRGEPLTEIFGETFTLGAVIGAIPDFDICSDVFPAP